MWLGPGATLPVASNTFCMYYGDHMSASDWGFMVLWTILFLALVVGAIWAIVSIGRRDQSATASGAPRSGREILDERLARGEIDVAEYDRLRGRLDGPTSAPQSPTPA
jgi:uncharacterized membrane protein